jgi:AcrR family transcriptional regulator
MRSARATRSRAARLEAGLALLAERAVDAIAIDELAAAAGVAKESFLNQFGDKDPFGASVVREVRLVVEHCVARMNAGVEDPLQRLAGGMIACAAYAMQRPDGTRVLVGANRGLSPEDHPLHAGLLHDLQDPVAGARCAACGSDCAGLTKRTSARRSPP